MNNEEIKTNLAKLFECKTDFTVTQTGKKSSKVNGFYKPATCEIFLHNKNFTSTNELMYTAVHEFTHHVLTTEKGVKTTKCHSGIFWAIFYDFLDKAIELGFYTRNRSDETKALIDSALQLQKTIIETQKQLGEIIAKLYDSCKTNGERIEDVIEHDLQITRNKAKEYIRLEKTDCTNSEMAKAVTAKDVMIQQAAQKAADEGKTVEQVKAIAKQKPNVDDDLGKKAKVTDNGLESPEKLLREKERLKRTIEQLNNRLVLVEEVLNSMTGNGK
ncbi:MAG: hypothetical protein MJ196_07650 [Treponemataceae bacterium]|nr:hypothetical protein [Treponemataceae bacterium]